MDLISSFFLTWALVLLPPIGLRVIRGTAFSKAWAIATALLLFFANHIIFAVITNQQSLRPFLTLGALVTFFALRWHTRASAADSAAAQRRALGYSLEASHPSTESPTLRTLVTSQIVSNPAFRSSLNRRGWIRIWIVATICWLFAVAGRLGYELNSEANSRLLAYRIDHAPTLSIGDLDRVERNLRKALEGEQTKSALSASAGSASPSDQYLDDLVKSNDARVLKLLPSEIAPLSTHQATALAEKVKIPVDAVSRAPLEAQRLRALIALRTSMDDSPVLRYQVLGYRSPSYEPRIMVIIIAALLPPIALILIWVIVTWIARGFRSEASNLPSNGLKTIMKRDTDQAGREDAS